MTPYTYLIGWSQHNTWYYGVRYAKGCTPNDLWTSYFTSPKEVVKCRLDWGEPDVVKVRREFTNGKDARHWEERVLRKLKAVKSPNWLNLSNNGCEFVCLAHDAKSRAKMSATRKGRPLSDAHRAKLSEARKGRTLSDEHKANIGAASRNRSEETRAKIGAAKKGLPFSDEHKAKLKQAWERRRAQSKATSASSII